MTHRTSLCALCGQPPTEMDEDVGKLFERAHEDPLKGDFAYHAACSQTMDDFKPGADGTHNVCAVGHCGDEHRALLMWRRRRRGQMPPSVLQTLPQELRQERVLRHRPQDVAMNDPGGDQPPPPPPQKCVDRRLRGVPQRHWQCRWQCMACLRAATAPPEFLLSLSV